MKMKEEGDKQSMASSEFDANRNRLCDYGRVVFVPDERNGFALGRLVDIGSKTLAVELFDSSKTVINIAYENVFSTDEDVAKEVDDNCALMYLNEATLLHNCRLRYEKRKIYTYVANILISINPYQQIVGLYDDATIRAYEGKSLGALAPHIFAVADKAYRDMRRLRRSQSIIVSGESGAGKTETQKYVLRYLCQCWGAVAGQVEARLLETNAILEAFGNAKTLRNNNSSRFGKFVEIHFTQRQVANAATGEMAGGYVSHYLLEKTRVCTQQRGERNFHVFYQLFAAGDETIRRLRLNDPRHFNYLRGGCTQFFARDDRDGAAATNCVRDAMVDDFADFTRLNAALLDIGFSTAERDDSLSILAGILHLGNIEFDKMSDDSRGGTRILQSSESALINAAELLGMEASQLRLGLTSRMMQPTRSGVKGTLIMVPLKSHECAAARDALAKALYSRLFDTIVARINASIPFQSSGDTFFIGILDIAGFEFFEKNSFEQFCINYCNEKLQQFFNDRILRQEQELYANEGLNVPRIKFADNQDCIGLFEQKASGLLDLLDEEARLPRSCTRHFTLAVQQRHCNHARLAPARKSVTRRHRELRDDEGFLVRHYAANVCYETTDFLEKNNDALHESLEMLLLESNNAIVRQLIKLSVANGSGETSGGMQRKSAGRLNAASVGSKFRAQLAVLVDKLAGTSTHFVRCVKPNVNMAPGQFAGALILDQLKCAGMASVLRLMQCGFPSRTSFAELYKMYESALPPRLARLDARLFCKCLFYALGLSDADYQFGLTKAFFRAGKFAEFDQLMRQDPQSMRKLIERVNAWIHRVRWRKLQYGAWSCVKRRLLISRKIAYRAAHLIRLQSALRGALARRHHRPRIFALQKLRKMNVDNVQLIEIAQRSLEIMSCSVWTTKLNTFSNDVERLMQRVKEDLSITASVQAFIKSECDALQTRFDAHVTELKTQTANEESERLRRLQEEALRQQTAKEIEERERQAQQSFLEESKQLEAQRLQAISLDAQRKTQISTTRQNDQVLRNVTTQGTQTSNGDVSFDTYNLISWTYARLRDAINTSTNIDFLEACRAEFRRRLNAYQKWKAENEQARVAQSCSTTTLHQAEITRTRDAQRIQRYFRVPFEKPVGINDYSGHQQLVATCGFWYAHFDGQFIARQMELHPAKPPLLLLAGHDDDKMCELTLDETRLMHKKGAEILACDFDALWTRHSRMNNH